VPIGCIPGVGLPYLDLPLDLDDMHFAAQCGVLQIPVPIIREVEPIENENNQNQRYVFISSIAVLLNCLLIVVL
jgi:hypothetical protein